MRYAKCKACGGKGLVPKASAKDLRLARENARLTVRELGWLLGHGSGSYVHQIEKGTRTPSPDLIERWFEATERRG